MRTQVQLADFFHVNAIFQFEHQFADVLLFYFGNGRLVWPQHPTTKPLAQAATHLNSRRLDNRILPMFQVDINQPVVRRIVEYLAVLKLKG